MKLELPTHLAESYKSKSQIVRVITESWVAENAYCPNCVLCRCDSGKPPQCSGSDEDVSDRGYLAL